MSGKEHDIATVALAALGGYALFQVEPGMGAAFFAACLVGGLYLSPDLDLPHSNPTRRWGPLRFLWAPYQALHPHRGRSHSYVYGPLSRLLYASLLFLLPLLLLGGGWEEPTRSALLEKLGTLPPETWWGGILGYFASQWLHLIMDGILPFGMRKRSFFS